MTGLAAETRLALRSLLRRPTLVFAVVVTLGVGIGFATALYSVVDGVLLRPLPFAEPDRLVWLHETAPGLDVMSVSVPNLADWRSESESFEALGGLRWESVSLTGSEAAAERVEGLRVSAELLRTLGVSPAAGRLFSPEEDRPGADPVALLGHGLWQRRFGGDPGLVGRAISIQGERRIVIGVLPERFRLDGEADVVLPLGPWSAGRTEERGSHPGLWAVGRLAPGTGLEAARAEMASIAAALAERHPDTNAHNGVVVVPLREWLIGDVRPSLLLLLAAVGLLLAIACSNVANLMLARATEELGELRVRVALGARGRHLLRRVFAECLLLAGAGGLAGWLLASWGLDLLLALAPAALPRQEAITLDGRVLAFAIAATGLAALTFGLAPALAALRRSRGVGALAGAARGAVPGDRVGRALVAAETALALVLLVGGGLLVRSLQHAVAVDPGFAPDGVLTARLELPAWEYDRGAEVAGFHRRLLEEVEGLPGVASAALSTGLPLAGASEWSFWPAGRPMPDPPQPAIAVGTAVSAGYFETLGIEIVSGRPIDERDRAAGPRAVVVDERLAERFFPGGGAVGEALAFDPELPAFEIVGVARHVRHYGLDTEGPVEPQLYVASAQWPEADRPDLLLAPWLAVRAEGAVEPLSAAVRARVAALDPDVSAYRVRPYADVVGGRLAARRFTLVLLLLFAVVAAGLAGLGLYGVLAYAVSRRSRELGVRAALGATPGRILGQVVAEGVRLAAAGAAIGLVAALSLGELVEGLLFGITAHDPPTYAAIAALLFAVAAAASIPPALRAARSDPRDALAEGP